MRTVVFNSQKGGSGKTTACVHFAVEAERVGEGRPPVVLIDTDPQGTLTTWHEHRQADTPARVEIQSLADLPDALGYLAAGGTELVLIDTAPSRSVEVAALFRLADLVVVPVRPSPSDLWAAGATVDLLRQTGVPFVFLLNQIKPRASITAQAAAALSAHGRVLPVFLGDRVPYAAAFNDGQTAGEIVPASHPAVLEIRAAWAHLQAALDALPAMKETVTYG